MKREIKFRAKRLDNGKWAYGGLVEADDYCIIDQRNELYVDEDYKFKGDTHFFRLSGVMCDENTIGQFTGLRDRNDKEIYEGDIIKVTSYRNIGMSDCFYTINELQEFSIQDLKGELQKEEIGEVKFEDGEFIFSDYHLSAFFGDMRFSNPIFEFEIVGNIYDTPELLKGERP